MNEILFAGKHFITYNVSRHQHSSWELIYCTGECGRFVFDYLEIPYQEGDIVVIPPETPHENLSEGGFTNIHLNISSATLTFQQPVMIRDDENETLRHLFSDAYLIYCGDAERRAAVLDAYGHLIVLSISTSQPFFAQNRIVAQIEQSIVQNYADANYELDAFLDSMPYCQDYLCRLFRKEKGTTPHRYLIGLRLQSAAAMLCSVYNDVSINEIAHLCGFHNALYFSRMFKKKYGVSPSVYCQQRLDQNQPVDSDSQKIIVPQ